MTTIPSLFLILLFLFAYKANMRAMNGTSYTRHWGFRPTAKRLSKSRIRTAAKQGIFSKKPSKPASAKKGGIKNGNNI